MAGYRGDGYGIHGDVGDDDFRFGDGQREERGRERSHFEDEHRQRDRGAAHGNLFGRIEREAAGAFFRHRDGEDTPARDAADAWNRRFGREGYEGSYARDDGYQRYRDNHLAELDRDYDDWCREREQQFHHDFNDWRSRRRQQQVTNQPGDEAMVLTDRATDSLTDNTSDAEPARRSKRPRR
jgi:hypothetical protein